MRPPPLRRVCDCGGLRRPWRQVPSMRPSPLRCVCDCGGLAGHGGRCRPCDHLRFAACATEAVCAGVATGAVHAATSASPQVRLWRSAQAMTAGAVRRGRAVTHLPCRVPPPRRVAQASSLSPRSGCADAEIAHAPPLVPRSGDRPCVRSRPCSVPLLSAAVSSRANPHIPGGFRIFDMLSRRKATRTTGS